jgi:hypothetical protein
MLTTTPTDMAYQERRSTGRDEPLLKGWAGLALCLLLWLLIVLLITITTN